MHAFEQYWDNESAKVLKKGLIGMCKYLSKSLKHQGKFPYIFGKFYWSFYALLRVDYYNQDFDSKCSGILARKAAPMPNG